METLEDRRVSTGLPGLDRVIDGLRLGDNVVWQVSSIDGYRRMVRRYVGQALAEERTVVYIRFADHDPLIRPDERIRVHEVDPTTGFESFATAINRIIGEEGLGTFYVFDCLSDLLSRWHSDLMIGNFFKVTCPYLFELDTVAYFALIRDEHTFDTVAEIRATTQVLLDLFEIDGRCYVHPVKAWQRYSPTMFFPHLLTKTDATCITSSAESARLFSSIDRGRDRPDHWNVLVARARDALRGTEYEQRAMRDLLISVLIGRDGRMTELCRRHLSLAHLVAIATREIGTGYIGGKSVGMLVARAILEQDPQRRFVGRMEPHDSYFLGADIFYSYIVANGWWKLRTRQTTQEGYFPAGAELHEKLLHGAFPPSIREQFTRMLEHFGQSPIIVRSSSLLEDNFGNAFAGKYDSVFCANQGTPEERFQAFEDAVRAVYSSAMSADALSYRLRRRLFDLDEQMAILVQRVSGDHLGEHFFPHAAGVGNSSNLYVWDADVDMEAGMLRLVFGLGTRAVDRTYQDYARIVTLDQPLRVKSTDPADRKRYSQRFVDVLSLRENALQTVPLDAVRGVDIKTDWGLFLTRDLEAIRLLRERGRKPAREPVILDFEKLLAATDFAPFMRDLLATVTDAYDYPVDIEFTVNFTADEDFQVNLVQCRPLQTRGLGHAVAMPDPADERCFFRTIGNFMGGNVRLPIDYVASVRPAEYLALGEQDRYAVARALGRVNRALRGNGIMLVGPGRWGTSTPSLGVPVNFSDISHISALCEVAFTDGGFSPELSYGSHFFQDLVESGIFYAAIFDGHPEVLFNPGYVLDRPNVLSEVAPEVSEHSAVIHVAHTPGLAVFSDVVSQRLVCCPVD